MLALCMTYMRTEECDNCQIKELLTSRFINTFKGEVLKLNIIYTHFTLNKEKLFLQEYSNSEAMEDGRYILSWRHALRNIPVLYNHSQPSFNVPIENIIML